MVEPPPVESRHIPKSSEDMHNYLTPCTLLALSIAFWGSSPASLSAQENQHPVAGKIERIDCSTVTAKVVCGYQAWFRCPEDGSNTGWRHYGRGRQLQPGQITIDLWPDVSELPAEERFATEFRHADGRVAEVYSSYREAAVRMHFRWMQEYGIDGVFVQRFPVDTRDPSMRSSMDTILSHCQKAADEYGRGWILMYDLSGVRPGQIDLVIDDWKRLHREQHIDIRSDGYFQHRGKPLVALWGLGFNDRPPMLDDWQRLIDVITGDSEFGRCSLMLGVPYFWRTQNRDTIDDPRLLDIVKRADIVSPWAVGRLNTVDDVERLAAPRLRDDIAWCRERQLDYLPVIYPGFSWHNLSRTRRIDAPVNQIPRRGGEFLTAQASAALSAGAEMVYVAMFDELDEGTAIFKTNNDPPVGDSPFAAEPDLPSDHYLKLVGEIGKQLRAAANTAVIVP